MSALEALRGSIPDAARDIKLNLQSVMQQSTLSAEQRWGVAIASAIAARNPRLREAILSDARAQASPAVVEDAMAAAALMAMNNVYYRFRHFIGKPRYSEKPARLRMNHMLKPAGSKADFELFSLAVSAINGCETCVQAHERVVLAGGLTEDQVHDAVRIAATVHAAAIALEMVAPPDERAAAEALAAEAAATAGAARA
jgi:alkyl hydroperoxide reductase subunit D